MRAPALYLHITTSLNENIFHIPYHNIDLKNRENQNNPTFSIAIISISLMDITGDEEKLKLQNAIHEHFIRKIKV